MSYSAAPRVKICGITSVEDALMAVDAGADAIGLVFYEPSPRCVSTELAADIARSVGALVTVVGLFVNANAAYIDQVLKSVPIHVLQFHGDEAPAFCEQFARPYMKAIRMKPDIDVMHEIQSHPTAVSILLDAYRKGVPGGTGETFDWQRVPTNDDLEAAMKRRLPIILAGGLDPDNVSAAIRQTNVYGVDVSGGVELLTSAASITRRKDAKKVTDFIRNAKAVS